MYSPFPGMDPFLEGYLWDDVHQALAYQFRKQLVPLVEPAYAVRLAVYMLTDRMTASELGIMYPDVEVLSTKGAQQRMVREPSLATTITPATIHIPVSLPIHVRQTKVEVRDVGGNVLVTSIEILSPANKREPGLSDYQTKRDELRLAGVNVLEIDLIRRGTRLWISDNLPHTPYLAVLARGGQVEAEVWPISLHDQLPVLPVPLRSPDPDVPLDLQAAIHTVYEEARYDLTIDYRQPPPEPELSEEERLWIARRLRHWPEKTG